MSTKLPVKIVVGLAACTWALVLFVQGAPVNPAFFRPMSIVVGLVSTTLAVFDRWGWRWPVLRRLVGQPDLEGTWIGEIRSAWVNPLTGLQIGPIRAALVIRQTFTTLTVTLYTKESQSVTTAASLLEEPDGRFAVTGIYRNDPRLSVQGRSRPHFGGLRLQAVGTGEDRLVGSYWTDRCTSGEMEFRFVERARARDFEAAEAAGVASLG